MLHVIAERSTTTGLPALSFPSKRRRVVGVGGGAVEEGCIAQAPDIPKWTCTTWGEDMGPKKANRFLPTASIALKVKVDIKAAPTAKRPLGEVALNDEPTRFVRWRWATRCTECPSTIYVERKEDRAARTARGETRRTNTKDQTDSGVLIWAF